MKKVLSLIGICCVFSAALTGCSAGEAVASSSQPVGSATVGEPAHESSSAASSLAQSSTALPTRFETYDGWIVDLDMEQLTADLPPQLLVDEPICYRLSQAIMNLSYFGGTDWTFEFDSIGKANLGDLMLGALYHTPEIKLPLDYSSDIGYYSKEFPNHPLVELLSREYAEGRGIETLFYQDDVERTFRFLYGDGYFKSHEELTHGDLYPYYYYKKEGVYGSFSGFGGPMWPYPQVTDYTKTDDGYSVDVISIWALDKENPLEEDDVSLTKKNFMKLTQKLDWIRYTFITAEDGRLLLDGVKYLRGVPGVDSNFDNNYTISIS